MMHSLPRWPKTKARIEKGWEPGHRTCSLIDLKRKKKKRVMLYIWGELKQNPSKISVSKSTLLSTHFMCIICMCVSACTRLLHACISHVWNDWHNRLVFAFVQQKCQTFVGSIFLSLMICYFYLSFISKRRVFGFWTDCRTEEAI